MLSQPWNLHLVSPGAENVKALAQGIEQALAGEKPLMLAPDQNGPDNKYLQALLASEPAFYEDTAVAICTSGSTGDPKGVEISHQALIKNHDLINQKLKAKANWVLAINPAFIGGFTMLTRGVIDEGWTYGLTEQGKFNVDNFSRAALLAAEHNPTIRTSLVWAQLMQLINADKFEILSMFDTILVGGSKVEPQIFEKLKTSGLKLVSTYGMTETSGGLVWEGRPLAEVDIKIFEKDEYGTGRIAIKSPTNASGYRDHPELNREVFRDGWVQSQDLGQFNEGYLTVLGRIDDVVATGGTNVSTKAVEEVILDCHGVEEAIVLAIDDSTWGSIIVAVIVGEYDKFEIENRVVAQLGSPAKPRLILNAENLPLLPNGKVDVMKLKEIISHDVN